MEAKESVSNRRKKIYKYRDYARRLEKDLGKSGLKIHAEDINFERKFNE